MRKRLLLLDLVLAALVIVLVARVRDRWLEARKREAVVLHQAVRPAPAPPYQQLDPVKPAAAGDYADIAQQNLFSADRNPNAIVELPKPPDPPPLPLFYGAMDVGDGPLAIMSTKAGAGHEEVKVGGKIGEYKMVALGLAQRQLTLEWEGKKFVKKFEELEDHSTPVEAPAAASAPAPAPPPASSGPTVITAGSGATNAPGGAMRGTDMRVCQKGDTSPAGTRVNGFVKKIARGPMGEQCYWEPAR